MRDFYALLEALLEYDQFESFNDFINGSDPEVLGLLELDGTENCQEYEEKYEAAWSHWIVLTETLTEMVGYIINTPDELDELIDGIPF